VGVGAFVSGAPGAGAGGSVGGVPGAEVGAAVVLAVVVLAGVFDFLSPEVKNKMTSTTTGIATAKPMLRTVRIVFLRFATFCCCSRAWRERSFLRSREVAFDTASDVTDGGRIWLVDR